MPQCLQGLSIVLLQPTTPFPIPDTYLVLCCVCPGALLFLGSCSVHPQMHCQRVRLMYGVSCVSSGRARDNSALPSPSLAFHSILFLLKGPAAKNNERSSRYTRMHRTMRSQLTPADNNSNTMKTHGWTGCGKGSAGCMGAGGICCSALLSGPVRIA